MLQDSDGTLELLAKQMSTKTEIHQKRCKQAPQVADIIRRIFLNFQKAMDLAREEGASSCLMSVPIFRSLISVCRKVPSVMIWHSNISGHPHALPTTVCVCCVLSRSCFCPVQKVVFQPYAVKTTTGISQLTR